jgi:pyruvate kinase
MRSISIFYSACSACAILISAMRKAKIVCTIGPASISKHIISELIKNGMDVARLNFSHGDPETHKKVSSIIKNESSAQKKIVSILQDLQGIKIRVGDIEGGSALLKAGDDVLVYPGTGTSSRKGLFISYSALLKDVKEGDSILLDDGLIKLIVIDKTRKALRTRIVEGGILKPRKGVNLPASKTSLPAFTEKDRNDLEFGLKMGIDYAAISFVRTAEDIGRVLNWAKKNNLTLPPLIAKIEKPEALENIDDIIDIADGIMVARGDLGVEIPAEKVPMAQKMLINLANRKGRLVITATQMLESMTNHTRPTRAEATDVANAVLDGSDALMLSAETAAGKYPVEALKMMDMIIRYTEGIHEQRTVSQYRIGNTFSEAVADGACKAAHDIGANAIVVFTHSGFTARLMSKLRPDVPIIAFTPDEKVLRQMPLCWNVIPELIKRKDVESLDSEFMEEIEDSLVRDKIAEAGDSIVFAASSPFLGKPNIIRLHRL